MADPLLYNGPIIDAHHHLWDLSMKKHPWLAPEGDFGPKGVFGALKERSYLLDDYRRDIAGQNVIASVHIEALWDPEDGYVNETRWLETLDKSDAIATRYVAGVAFGVPETESVLRAQASFSRVVAVRQTIAWTPDPDRTMVFQPDLTETEEFRDATAVVADLGLVLELLLYPQQAANVVALAAAFPGLQIMVNHIGSPQDQSPEGIALWRSAISEIATAPNVAIKVSSVPIYLDPPTTEGVGSLVTHVAAEFGPERILIGSDFPVGGLTGFSFAQEMDAYRYALADLTKEQQEDAFFRNAARVYGIDLASPSDA